MTKIKMWFLNTHQQQSCLQQDQMRQKPREGSGRGQTPVCVSVPPGSHLLLVILEAQRLAVILVNSLSVILEAQRHRCQHLKSSNMGTSTPIHWATENSAWLSLAKHISIHTHQLFTQKLCQKKTKTHRQKGLNQQEQGFIYIYTPGPEDKGP